MTETGGAKEQGKREKQSLRKERKGVQKHEGKRGERKLIR